MHCLNRRLANREIVGLRRRYDRLLGHVDRSDSDAVRLADTAMRIIEFGVFGHRSIEQVQSILNAIPSDSKVRRHASFRDVEARSRDRIHNAG